MSIEIEIVMLGTTPLLCRNPQMVDPEIELNRHLKAITKKKKKTDEDNRQIEKMEWFGGLYTANIEGKVVITQPCSKVRKCLINTARITKQGKQIERSVIMPRLDVAIIYPGSEKVKDIDDETDRLYKDSAFVSRLSVGLAGKRIMRIRPQFSPWALIVPVIFLDDAGLNFDEFQRIVDLAGRAERIGDNRVNGYGSFLGHARILAGVKSIPTTISDVRAFFEALHGQEAA